MHNPYADNLPAFPKNLLVVTARAEELAEKERFLEIAEIKAKAAAAWRKLGAPTTEGEA